MMVFEEMDLSHESARSAKPCAGSSQREIPARIAVARPSSRQPTRPGVLTME